MTEIRAVRQPACETLSVRRSPASLADVSLRPLIRGLFFMAALSLPVLGCVIADRFHGSASRATQVVAAPHIPPHRGAAASSWEVTPLRFAEAGYSGASIEH